jgi:hypothetical protein
MFSFRSLLLFAFSIYLKKYMFLVKLGFCIWSKSLIKSM